jgi:hypothetical protein
MVLHPPYHGINVSHLQILGKEATCPYIVSLGIRMGTLEEEE